MCSVCGGRRAAGASPIRCVGERITATGVPEFREVAWRACFIQSYIDDLNDALNQLKPGAALTRIQAAWLGTCLTGILLMNSVCWAKFERASLGDCKVAALSWVFRTLSAPDGLIVSRRRREICQSEVRDSARGRLKFYPE
ncbi:hypothetical protein [Bathymodiolus japonicus methanotrophic gill symbiont]|uniref:hypothetical protein n=1 Tax=Bathymodiolus japonicus methanotrophic gill symbiont TaxID=113269 RepID=UPI001C8E05E5|nr:hypothetical protein [Bathymodiolus japonicus methanotrophic gill symbiont]